MEIVTIIVTVLTSLLASSGLWAYLQKRSERKDQKRAMLIGLGHDRIMALGMFYIERGWITDDEYENLVDYLYKPYADLGGNGAAKRVVEGVKKLEIRKARETTI